MNLTTFLLVSTALIATPGPNVLVVVSTTMSNGLKRGLQTVAGTSVAMLLQLLLAGLTTGVLVATLDRGLQWLRWGGVVWLCYLGVKELRQAWYPTPSPPLSAAGSFRRGFLTSLSNPKTILFFAAFLPQFAAGDQPFLPQIVLLSAIFWCLAVVLDSAYAVLAGQIGQWLQRGRWRRYSSGLAGSLYLGAGVLLAFA